MKKLLVILVALMMLMMSACAKQEEEPVETGQYLIRVNTNGMGNIAVVEGEGDPQFDEEFPVQSFGTYVAQGTLMTLAARPDENSMFVKWTMNDVDFSEDPQITVKVEEDCEYIAVFSMSNDYDGPTAENIEDVKTLGDVLGLPYLGYTCLEDKLIYGFELKGVVYRAIAAISPETSAALFDLDFFDPDYQSKFNALLAPIEVDHTENVTELIPDQAELDAYVGKTGEDLINEGWSINYFNADENVYGMSHGFFDYAVKFAGDMVRNDDLTEDVILPLTVASVTYEGIGDATNPDVELGQ